MFGKKSAIRNYNAKLRPELSIRYGGIGPYSKSQIDVTVHDLKLSKRHIQYAYLIFSDVNELDNSVLRKESIPTMQETVIAALGTGFMFDSASTFIYGDDSGGGGFGDGGGE